MLPICRRLTTRLPLLLLVIAALWAADVHAGKKVGRGSRRGQTRTFITYAPEFDMHLVDRKTGRPIGSRAGGTAASDRKPAGKSTRRSRPQQSRSTNPIRRRGRDPRRFPLFGEQAPTTHLYPEVARPPRVTLRRRLGKFLAISNPVTLRRALYKDARKQALSRIQELTDGFAELTPGELAIVEQYFMHAFTRHHFLEHRREALSLRGDLQAEIAQVDDELNSPSLLRSRTRFSELARKRTRLESKLSVVEDLLDELSVLPVAGRQITNREFAGKTYYFTQARREARHALLRKYPNGVPFSRQGFPIFDEYALRNRAGDMITAWIEIRGGVSDYNRANEAVGLSETPAGYTWHHTEEVKLATDDRGMPRIFGTLILVPTDLHKVGHDGGDSLSAYATEPPHFWQIEFSHVDD